ncbi:MAG: glutathione S-transferase [Gammaproteobacteria bacterium]|jgi:glutathione S-transferase
MKLYVSRTSPYARVVRMAIEELRLSAQVEIIVVRTRVPECEVNAFVPTGKVPVLETDDGHYFAESRLICQYLDALHTDDPIVDHDPLEADRAFEGVVTGFLDGVSVWIRELGRAQVERSPGIVEQERARAERCVDWLEQHLDAIGERIDYPRLCLAAALVTLDERVEENAWRQRAPGLVEWFGAFSSRPSFQATRPQASPGASPEPSPGAS